MADIVTLTVNGRAWSGWESMTVSRSMEALAASFSLQLTDRWEPEGEQLIVSPDSPCTIALGGDVVVTGYVDDVDIGLADGTHTLSVRGRDASADMVDCSAVHQPGEWAGVSLSDIAAKLAAPFQVRVSPGIVSPERFEKFAIQPGETAYTALERACRLRGVLPMADGLGGIVLAKPATDRATEALVEGQNVLEESVHFSRRDRYSHYMVRGQNAGSDDTSGEAVAHVSGAATDAALTRYRPLLVTAEGRATKLTARNRARYEAVVRAGRSAEVSVSVAGWRQGDGSLWPVNALVSVLLPTLRVSCDLVITSVEFSLSGSGSTTQLTLRRPDAFADESAFAQPEPVVRTATDPTPVAQAAELADYGPEGYGR